MKKLFALVFVLAIMVFVAACRTDEPDTGDETGVTPQEGVTPVVPGETPAPGVTPTTDEFVFGELPAELGGVLPRNETLFFGGHQWGAPVSNNPFTLNPQNGMVMANEAMTNRNLVHECLFMFNHLTGQLVPLLAAGPYRWNADMSVLTVDINPDAHWSNGTPVLARDMERTWEMHEAIGTPTFGDYNLFFNRVVASGERTIEIHLNMENHNTLRAVEFLGRVFVLSADFIDERLAAHGGDLEAFRNDPWQENLIHSGPYRPRIMSIHQIVLERNDNYWGQAASMWGSLPAPRFIVHNIYESNDAKRASFAAGQIDVNQQFLANVWELWEAGLPISTFLPDPPFYLPGTMPSIWFNTTRPGLDQTVVRSAIAFAIDYEQIIAAAMSGYSPTFAEAPRSIAVPLPGEQRFVDNAALADLQWGNADIERANRILDEAGILRNANGIREWQGEELSFTLMCPSGWSDWEASLAIVAAAGAHIGINLTTNFVEMSVWVESMQTGDFDIIMNSTAVTSISAPWSRAFGALHIPDPDAERFFRAPHRLYNPEINDLIVRAGRETDEARLREYMTEISRFILTEKPFVALMYRPSWFHTVNESVWTGFPEYGDGTNIPPQAVLEGYAIATLYRIRPIN